MNARRQAKPSCGIASLNLTYPHKLGGALKLRVDVCCPTVCDIHVRSDGGTNAQGVDREVHVFL